jgi:hypothetical protein
MPWFGLSFLQVMAVAPVEGSPDLQLRDRVVQTALPAVARFCELLVLLESQSVFPSFIQFVVRHLPNAMSEFFGVVVFKPPLVELAPVHSLSHSAHDICTQIL